MLSIKYRTIALGAVMATASLVMSGCAANTEADAGDEKVTLTLLQASGAETWQPVIDLYEEQNPNVTIEQEVVPFSELIAQTQARLGGGDSSIDLIATDPPRLPSMVSRGFLSDVSSDLPAMEESLLPAAISSVTWEDKQYAYPIWTSDMFLFYNMDLLDAAGVEHPGQDDASRLTWEQVTAGAADAVAEGAANGLQFEQVDRFYPLQPEIASLGGGPGLEGDDSLTPNVNSKGWLKFGDWYSTIHADGIAPRGVDATQTTELFTSGQLAYFISVPGRITDFQASGLKDNWGMAPLPYFEGGEVVTPTDSWSVGVSAFGEHQEASKDFARFATLTLDGALALSSVYALPPAHNDALPAYMDRINALAPEATSGYAELFAIDTAEHAVHRPSSIGYVEFETLISKAFADIRNGGDVKTILDSAQDSLERQLGQLQ